jgi:hypothetical protein
MGWATFWAPLSQTHLVTLFPVKRMLFKNSSFWRFLSSEGADFFSFKNVPT